MLACYIQNPMCSFLCLWKSRTGLWVIGQLPSESIMRFSLVQNRLWSFLCCWKSQPDPPVKHIINCELFGVHLKSRDTWPIRHGKSLESWNRAKMDWSPFATMVHPSAIPRRMRACHLRQWEKWCRIWKLGGAIEHRSSRMINVPIVGLRESTCEFWVQKNCLSFKRNSFPWAKSRRQYNSG
jgi:hypothetical protein